VSHIDLNQRFEKPALAGPIDLRPQKQFAAEMPL